MGTVTDLMNALTSFDIKKEAIGVVERNKQHFVTLNQSQLLKGEKKDGTKLKGYKLKWYAELKNKINPLPGLGTPDLKLTGSFYKGMFASVDGDNINEFSTDEKAEALQNKYGPGIFGLQDPNQEIFNETIILPDYLGVIEQKTGLRAST
jgi:hypothetical protein